jgi:hypothetical protein
MKTLALLCLLLIPAFAAAEMGTWTLYYCDTETVDGSGNLVVTPTVSLTGNDGGNFCDPQSCNGLEQAFVMLNGNAWQAGYTVNAGLGNPSQVYTFPDVTIAPGASADLSYAGKVEGTIQLNGNEYWTSPNMIAFYQTAFEDGNGVYAPSPCWINGYAGNSPACEDTWPTPWALPIRGWATYDLDSQQVALSIGYGYTTQWFSHIYDPLGKVNVDTSMQPCSALCTSPTLTDVPGPYWSYLSNIQDWISYNGPPKADKSNVFCIPLGIAQKPGQNQVPPRPFCYDTTLH